MAEHARLPERIPDPAADYPGFVAGVQYAGDLTQTQFIEHVGGTPDTIGRMGGCGVLSVILQANLHDMGVSTQLRARPPIPGKVRHFFLRTTGEPGSRVCLDYAWQQYLPSELRYTTGASRMLVCRERDLLGTLSELGVPEDRLDLWADAVDTAATWRYFGEERLGPLFADRYTGPEERV